jgi:peptide/nickel transport system permease protein
MCSPAFSLGGSLLVGFSAGIGATLFDGLLGATSADFGRWLDVILCRLVDTLFSVPQFLLLLILSGLLATRESALALAISEALGPAKSIVIIILVITCLSWISVFRLVRGEVLSLKEREFILASKAIGASCARTVFRHLLPNAGHVLIVQATLIVGEAILIEAGLLFLGWGSSRPRSPGATCLRGRRNICITPTESSSPSFLVCSFS